MRVVLTIVGIFVGFLIGGAVLGFICDTAGCEDSLDVWFGFLTLGLSIAGGVIGYRLPSKIANNANSGELSRYQGSLKCLQCGSELRQEGLFCGSCGARKRPISSPVTTAKRGSPLLIVTVIIGVIILALSISFVLASNSERNDSMSEVPSDVLTVPTATLVPPTATSTPVPLNIYRSKKFGFSLSYTSAWIVEERVQYNAPPEVMPDIVFSDPETGFTHVVVEIEKMSSHQGSIYDLVNRRIHGDPDLVADPDGVPIDHLSGFLFHGVRKEGELATRVILVLVNDPWDISVVFIPHPLEVHDAAEAPFPALEWPRINEMVESFELFPAGV